MKTDEFPFADTPSRHATSSSSSSNTVTDEEFYVDNQAAIFSARNKSSNNASLKNVTHTGSNMSLVGQAKEGKASRRKFGQQKLWRHQNNLSPSEVELESNCSEEDAVAVVAKSVANTTTECPFGAGFSVRNERLPSSSASTTLTDEFNEQTSDTRSVACYCHHSDNEKACDYQSEVDDKILIKFASIMYATLLIILGCVLHVSELRQKSLLSMQQRTPHLARSMSSSLDHNYCICVTMIGFAWLAYLHFDLQRYKRSAHENLLRVAAIRARATRPGLGSSSASSSHSNSTSASSLINSRLSVADTEIVLKKSAALQMYERRNARAMKNKPHSIGAWPGDKEAKPAYKFVRGKLGANFYLKCGMAAFCFGHVIHEGLRFGQQLYFFVVVADSNRSLSSCQDMPAMVAHLVTPLYSFYQLFMLFKYSNLVINRHKTLARFGLMHIIGTSVTFWFRTIIEEAFEDFVHKIDKLPVSFGLPPTPSDEQSASNLSTTAANSHLFCAQNTLLTAKSMNALPYLYPFTIEYNLLLAATFLSLYMNIGNISSGDCKQKSPHLQAGHNKLNSMHAGDKCLTPNCNNKCGGKCSKHAIDEQPMQLSLLDAGLSKKQTAGSFLHEFDAKSSLSSSPSTSASARLSATQAGDEFKSNFVVNADCHSATIGLFGGFFVLLVMLVTIVIFFVTINKPTHLELGIKINAIQEATLTVLLIVVTALSFKQVSKLRRTKHKSREVSIDDVLMLIPLPFFFVHTLLSFRAELSTLTASGSVAAKSVTGSSVETLNSLFVLAERQLLDAQESTVVAGVAGLSRAAMEDQLAAASTTHRRRTNHAPANSSRFDGNVSVLIAATGLKQANGNDTGSVRSRSQKSLASDSSGKQTKPKFSTINSKEYKIFTMLLNVLVMIEVLLQACFIIDCSRRHSDSKQVRFKKPGRELITFAIILNITYWIVATFETKSVEQYKTEVTFYGPLVYMFISHTTLPVMLFYRYHSSVCLAEIWTRAYKPAKH